MTILVIAAALVFLVLHIQPWGSREKPQPWQTRAATVLAVLGIGLWILTLLEVVEVRLG